MVSTETRDEIEAYLGLIPAEMEAIAEAAADHMWAFVRDLHYAETALSAREKALVGLGAAAAIKEPFCIRYYQSDAAFNDLTEEEIKEVVSEAATVNFFATILQGSEVDFDGFCDEVEDLTSHMGERA